MKEILRLSRKLHALACSDMFENDSPRESLLRFLGALTDEDTELMANMLELYGNKRVHKWAVSIHMRAAGNITSTSTSIKISF